MKLLNYLIERFVLEERLMEQTNLNEAELREKQAACIFPQPAYRLSLEGVCESFFGSYRFRESLAFYPSDAFSWLKRAKTWTQEGQAFAHFARRYRKQLLVLSESGFLPAEADLWNPLPDRIQKDWCAFLDGTYGLCTRDGSPECLVNKEVALALCQWLDAKPSLSHEPLRKMALDLLDQNSALFPEHEYARSSRARYLRTSQNS